MALYLELKAPRPGLEGYLPGGMQLGGSSLSAPLLSIGIVWLRLEFHFTNCWWRKAKIHLLGQPEVVSSWSLCNCPYHSVTAGCPLQLSV